MEEKRKYQRTEIDEPAYVSSAGSVMSCTVRNISPEGAAIDVENPAFVPPQFRLVMARDSSIRECKVIWISKSGLALRSSPCRTDHRSPSEPRGHFEKGKSQAMIWSVTRARTKAAAKTPVI